MVPSVTLWSEWQSPAALIAFCPKASAPVARNCPVEAAASATLLRTVAGVMPIRAPNRTSAGTQRSIASDTASSPDVKRW